MGADLDTLCGEDQPGLDGLAPDRAPWVRGQGLRDQEAKWVRFTEEGGS